MKNAWLILVLAAGTACQQQTNRVTAKQTDRLNERKRALADTAITTAFSDTSTTWSAKQPNRSKVSADSMPPIPVRFGKVLRNDLRSQPVVDSAKIRQFFAAHSLAALIQTVKGGQGDYAMNGFRGADHYRTEVAIISVRHSPQDPLSYLVQGLTRTKRHVEHFQGEITFDSLFAEPMLTAQDKRDIDSWTMVHIIQLKGTADKTIGRYAVVGSVRLSENKTSPQSASFQGRVVLELVLTKKGRVYINAPFLHGPSQGGEQKYAGKWTSHRTGQSSPSVWVKNIIGYGPFIYSDFVVGGRDVEINPKYAKQGWNTIWENDEWWAKSPKPKLSL